MFFIYHPSLFCFLLFTFFLNNFIINISIELWITFFFKKFYKKIFFLNPKNIFL